MAKFEIIYHDIVVAFLPDDHFAGEDVTRVGKLVQASTGHAVIRFDDGEEFEYAVWPTLPHGVYREVNGEAYVKLSPDPIAERYALYAKLNVLGFEPTDEHQLVWTKKAKV